MGVEILDRGPRKGLFRKLLLNENLGEMRELTM